MFDSQKGKEEGWGKGVGPLNPMEITLAIIGEAFNDRVMCKNNGHCHFIW